MRCGHVEARQAGQPAAAPCRAHRREGQVGQVLLHRAPASLRPPQGPTRPLRAPSVPPPWSPRACLWPSPEWSLSYRIQRCRAARLTSGAQMLRKRQSSSCSWWPRPRPSPSEARAAARPAAVPAAAAWASGCGQAGRKDVAASVPFQPRCRAGACGGRKTAVRGAENNPGPRIRGQQTSGVNQLSVETFEAETWWAKT